MAKRLSPYMRHFSTNARYIIHNWSSFSQLLTYFGAKKSDSCIDILQDSSVLEDAFNGGFAFCFRALASILVQIEQILTIRRIDQENPLQVTPDLLIEFGCSKLNLIHCIPAKLEKLRTKILNKLPELSQRLEKLHQASAASVLAALREQEVMLNENERQELDFIDTREGLIKRLDNLSLKSLQPEEVLSWGSYFRYKTAIVVKNAYSRLERHRNDNQVEQLLRQLKPCFETLQKEKDKFLIEAVHPFQNSLDELIRPQQPSPK